MESWGQTLGLFILEHAALASKISQRGAVISSFLVCAQQYQKLSPSKSDHCRPISWSVGDSGRTKVWSIEYG